MLFTSCDLLNPFHTIIYNNIRISSPHKSHIMVFTFSLHIAAYLLPAQFFISPTCISLPCTLLHISSLHIAVSPILQHISCLNIAAYLLPAYCCIYPTCILLHISYLHIAAYLLPAYRCISPT